MAKPSKRTNKFSYICYRIIKFFVWLIYPKVKVYGEENLPKEASIVVGNHSQLHGPIISELYHPRDKAIWCAGQMMNLKEVPAYAFQDFWSNKPKSSRWFFKIVSYIIAPLSVCIFNNASTIGVYHDGRIISTFKETITKLGEGADPIIFPECNVERNNVVYEFQRNFVDVAKLYYKRTQKDAFFVPMYIAPKLKSVYIGKPTQFDHNAPIEQERERICQYLMDEITSMAQSLPEHVVVPYPNLPKDQYKTNLASKEEARKD